jgi:hypothetical protein
MGMGGGGGGSSGKVEYPAYLQTAHGRLIDSGGTDSPSNSVVDAINAAYGNSPYIGINAYDPTTTLTTAEVPVTTLRNLNLTTALADALTEIPLIAAVVDPLVTDLTAKITPVVTAYTAMVDNEVQTKVLPKFRRGMQDINAVQTSSYVIGEALILAEETRDIAKFAADLELRAYDKRNDMIVQLSDYVLKSVQTNLTFHQTIAHISAEFARIKITAFKEQVEADAELDEKDAEWDLKLFQYGGNLIASIAGAAATVNKKPNQFMSALGGVMSGVAAGAAMGGAPGAAIGGVLGGIAGLFG